MSREKDGKSWKMARKKWSLIQQFTVLWERDMQRDDFSAVGQVSNRGKKTF